MIDIFAYAFMQRAFLAGIIIAISCALLGVFLVLRRLSLIGDGLAHAAFGGIALGVFFNINPIISALAAALLGTFFSSRIQKEKVYGETAIAIMIAAGLGLGVVLLSLAKGFTSDIFSFLFGSILTITSTDLLISAGLGILVIVSLLVFYRPLLFMTFDEEGAQVGGINIRYYHILLNILTALTIIVAVRLVGVLLVSALIVVPAATSLQISKSFKHALWIAVVVALASVIAGLFASYYLGIAAGGAIVLSSLIIFSGTLAARKIFSL